MTELLNTARPAHNDRPARARWLSVAAIAAGALALSACDGEISLDWDGETIEGSGTVTTEVYDVSDFTEIEVCCDMNVRFEFEEGPERVEIAIDDNLHSYLDIEVNGNDLEIKPDDNTHVKPTGEVVVTISGHQIDGLMIDTASDVSGIFPATDVFTVRADTAADVSIEIDTDRLTISADTSADLTVVGRADVIDVKADTAANVDLVDLEVVDASVEADTAASIEITASGSVTGAADTGADIHIWGNPTVDVETDTGADIHREG